MPVVTSLASNKKPPIEPIDWRFLFYHLQQPGSKNTTGCIIFMHLSSQPSLRIKLGGLLAKLELEDVIGKYIFFQACKSGGTSSGKYNEIQNARTAIVFHLPHLDESRYRQPLSFLVLLQKEYP